MITNITLHPSQNAQLEEADLHQIRSLATTEFPYPLAVSFQNFFEAVKKDDKTLALVIFANDVTTTVFQFLSLILASEYIESNAPRTLRMYQAIENMTYRPGPGKWLAFLREFYNYQQQIPDNLGKFPQILDFIEKHEIKKKSASLMVEENNGSSPSKKLGLLELMVNLRNNFAHSKGYDEGTLDVITSAVEQIVDLLMIDLAFLNQNKLMLSPMESGEPVLLMGAEIPNIDALSGECSIMIEDKDSRVRLFPMFINDKVTKGKTQDVFLLEALDNKKVFYASNRHISEKRTDKDPLAVELTNALKKIYVEPDVLDASTLSIDQFNKRVLQYSEFILAEYELNGKYNESVYVLPAGYNQLINAFFSSDKKIIFLRDEQGSGKSAFCAYLVNQYVKSRSHNRINFLLDARHLDEMGETPMLFDDFIKKKLGITGDLHEMLNGLQKKHPETTITITIDNLNEYYLKGVDQSMLMERLFDFLHRFQDVNILKVIAFARPEYFKKSIEKYAQQYKDKKIGELAFMPQSDNQGKPLITALLPALDSNELGQIWENYGIHYTGYTPRTTWKELNEKLKEHCSKPLIMLYLLKEYDNKTIPGKLSVDDIKRQYIESILKNKPYQETLFDLVKQMNKEKCPYLLTETMDDKLLRKINDSSKNTKTALPYNHAYSALTEMQLLREERVRKDNLKGKKITLNNEMSMDIILEKFKKEDKKKSLIFNISIIFIIGFTIFALLYLIYNQLAPVAHSFGIPLFSVIFNQIITPELNVNGDIVAILADLFYANYAIKSVLDQLFIPAMHLVSVLMLFFAIFLFINPKADKENNMLRNFNAYEAFHFNSISNILIRKLIRFFFILFGIVLIITFPLFLNNPESDLGDSIILLLIPILGLSVIVFLAVLYYKAILVEKSIYINYLRNSFSGSAKYLFVIMYFFAIGLFLLFYFSDTFMSYSQKRVHQTYVNKFEEKIKVIQSIATPSEIEILKQRMEDQYCSDPEDPACMLLDDIVNGLNNEEISLYTNVTEANEILSAMIQIGKKLTKYWYFFVFGPAALMLFLYFMVEISIFLARRKLQKEEVLSIA